MLLVVYFPVTVGDVRGREGLIYGLEGTRGLPGGCPASVASSLSSGRHHHHHRRHHRHRDPSVRPISIFNPTKRLLRSSLLFSRCCCRVRTLLVSLVPIFLSSTSFLSLFFLYFKSYVKKKRERPKCTCMQRTWI